MTTKNYPAMHAEIQTTISKLAKELPETMTGFSALHQHSVAEGAISWRGKELIALGIAIAVRCEGCIAFHVHDALKAGASRFEILETIGVAILMGGGPALMYGVEAYDALEQFMSSDKDSGPS